ncbi:MAG: response regulator transcription factor [Bacteroidota bacterium]
MEANDQNIHILLVEDDVNLGYLVVENLEGKDFTVTLAKTGKEGMDAITKGDFDMCILDVMLPGIDGWTLGSKLKAMHPSKPFIFLTARMQEADKLQGFELGADDYITKPFSFKELYYRIMVALKRINKSVKAPEKEALSLGEVTLNTCERMLTIKGNSRRLSQRETEVLAKLMQHAGSYVSRSEILKLVWGNDNYFTAKSMDVYITRLRKLLKDDPQTEIENLYASGYRIKHSQEASVVR